MPILIYSDVHGNLPAFERVLKVAGKCDGYICLGDLVNYGPWSNECVELAISLPGCINLIGNHEEAFINEIYQGDNKLVQQFFAQTFRDFKRSEEIKSFLSDTLIGKYTCKHTILDTYIYPDTHIHLDNNYIIGHSHHQFKYNSSLYTLINAGSVGQNRRFINVANYLLYYPDKELVELKSTTFSIDLLLTEMESLKYPEDCLNYYRGKTKL